MWATKVYYVYGFALLVALILLIVAACVSIVGTYFLLNSGANATPVVSVTSLASTGFRGALFHSLNVVNVEPRRVIMVRPHANWKPSRQASILLRGGACTLVITLSHHV